MLTEKLWALTVISMLLSACCANRLNFDEFRLMKLHDQVVAYDQARREHCVGENSTAFLDAIARHGYPAADVMTSSLEQRGTEFPADDAIAVLELVHFHGADLRGHEALKVLDQLARTTSDPALRKLAGDTAQRIRRNDPSFGRK
jgi:hypothetical protein